MNKTWLLLRDQRGFTLGSIVAGACIMLILGFAGMLILTLDMSLNISPIILGVLAFGLGCALQIVRVRVSGHKGISENSQSATNFEEQPIRADSLQPAEPTSVDVLPIHQVVKGYRKIIRD